MESEKIKEAIDTIAKLIEQYQEIYDHVNSIEITQEHIWVTTNYETKDFMVHEVDKMLKYLNTL